MSWWNRLSNRERWLVGAGGVLTLILILYALVWQPFQSGLERLRQTVAEQQVELAWMRQAAVEVKRLSSTPASSSVPLAQGDRPSLLIIVDQTARTAGLGPAVRRVEPQGNDQVRVWLEQVSFDDMIRWLDSLARAQGIQTANATVDPQAGSGRVNARLVLEDTAR